MVVKHALKAKFTKQNMCQMKEYLFILLLNNTNDIKKWKTVYIKNKFIVIVKIYFQK